ncbi:hypothetical protein GGD81_001401 [Rhodobium orientis]|uniref:DUF192 domain-containing protein n=1 Tax=Rhodobium orientis TaxID=34017 RepID=A0A327JJY6_9HYPH|nr:DUF192 domain-containing protein [Rhodobium orientis]MBB4302374.1 hypothetical protein [Rhodobium orientis]MBK5949078.1 hypothetical protein [Rhodobium orientis]RAI26597.1 hypothetical protein CH339_13410 [Rhodobium orientis]
MSGPATRTGLSQVRFFQALFLLVFAGLALGAAGQPRAADAAPVVLETATGSHSFTVEIADTMAKRTRGLMYRREMAPDHGMLFDFKRPELLSFWMKNTYISLDMIFIAGNGRVNFIARDTTPESTELISPPDRARFVLEVVGGTADRIGLKVGDRARNPLIGGDG